jgi:hypothetical protein
MKNYNKYNSRIKSAGITVLILGASLLCHPQIPVYPVKISPNSRYLVDQNNKPFPVLGRTAWFVISLSAIDYQFFINNTVSRGYNSIEMHVINHDPRGKNPPFNGNGDLPFLKCLDGSAWTGLLVYSDANKQAPDLTTPNETYWQFVDTFLSYCESRGVLVFFFPAYLGYGGGKDGWMKELLANGPAKTQAYGKWIAERYKNQKNLVWMLLGDMGTFTDPQKTVESALIKGLKSVPGQQSVHYSAESNNGQNSADQPDFGDQMTLNGTYTWGSVPSLGRIAYSHNPVIPAYLLEEPYDQEGPDGTNVSPNAIQPVRRFQWWGWLSTIGGYISGNGYVWPFPPDWKKHLDTQGSFDMGRLNNFIKSMPWWELVPSGLDGMKPLISINGGVPSDPDYVAAAATRAGTFLVAYIPPSHKGSITVDMTVMKSNIKASWYDPTSGTFAAIPGTPFSNKGMQQFTPPGKNQNGDNDWVLFLNSLDQNNSSYQQNPITAPLRASKNPNYFGDEMANPLILCGSQTWNTLQDWGTNDSIQPLDFDTFVSFLKAHGHNFTLLWYTELPKFHNLPTTEISPPDFTVSPFPWMRTGPGKATDGGLKFDLTKFDPAYFTRLRSRVEKLYNAGIYVGVYLFSGEWLLSFRCQNDGYPYTGPNNINGIDDGYFTNPSEMACASVTMTESNAITDFQDTYVRKVIDTINDLPNVLWIVSEESPQKSGWWNSHLISLIKSYEKEKPFQHPVGYAMPQVGQDSIVYNSDADWVAPLAWLSPEKSCGTGNPPCKVNINDSDHTYWEMWNDTPQMNRNYAWENFLNGNQVLFMDPYLVYYPRQLRNLCVNPDHGISSGPDTRWDNFRDNLGYILKYSRKLNLALVTPHHDLSSTGFCLAQTPPAGAEYLVYAPAGGSFKIDLSAMPGTRMLAVEWFNPANETTIIQSPVTAGSHAYTFHPPFSGDAVLYLVDTTGHK